MSKKYKYLVSWIGKHEDGALAVGHTVLETEAPIGGKEDLDRINQGIRDTTAAEGKGTFANDLSIMNVVPFPI